MSEIVANRCTRIGSRSPYGIGCRISPTLSPAPTRMRPISRLVWLLPLPVRTAQTETTGLVAASIVEPGPGRLKSAFAAWTRAAQCMTCSYGTSEYANTTSSTSSLPTRSTSSSSGRMGIPWG